jgi:acyl-CoA oxidase
MGLADNVVTTFLGFAFLYWVYKKFFPTPKVMHREPRSKYQAFPEPPVEVDTLQAWCVNASCSPSFPLFSFFFLFFRKALGAKYPAKVLTEYRESEEALKEAMRTFNISVEDLTRFKGSNKLFLAHRHGATHVECGLGIRITVQYNLFAGSVANLGSKEQKEWLAGVLKRQEQGCFALTEFRGGVLSGLIVDTTATFKEGGFVLEAAGDARKRWISNGLHAKWAVVIARLILGDEDKGPHAFIVNLESEGVIRTGK